MASNASGDALYAHRRQLAAQQKAMSAREGFKLGAAALKDGFASGFSGLVKQPVRGAMQGGARGAAKGVGLGIAGMFAKPVSGMAGFASKVTEGMGAEAKKLTPGAIEAHRAGQLSLLRIRQPRRMADGVVRPYPRTPLRVVETSLEEMMEGVAEEEEGEGGEEPPGERGEVQVEGLESSAREERDQSLSSEASSSAVSSLR